MSTTVHVVRRPASPSDVVALQWANPTRLVMPLIIIGAVIVVMIVISIGILRAGDDPAGTGYSGSILWSTVGFHVALGVQGVTASFPFALALGSSRPTFVAGTLVSLIGQATITTLASLALLGVETATDGWFVEARVLRDVTLGAGDPVALTVVVFLGVMTAFTVGGVFGAAWLRYGALGPTVLGLGLALLVAVALVVLLPAIDEPAFVFQAWWLAAAAVVIVAASLLGQVLFLRRASVR